MATQFGSWSADTRADRPKSQLPARQVLPAEHVANLITWIATAPADVVLDETIITPLNESGWP
jgi:NADP-dependent 3-hydroxy acid dehydrogenase YdfG